MELGRVARLDLDRETLYLDFETDSSICARFKPELGPNIQGVTTFRFYKLLVVALQEGEYNVNLIETAKRL